MELTLRIESGQDAGRTVPVPPGSTVRFGRLATAEVRVTDDPTLSGEHFGVRSDGRVGTLTDLGSRFGTLLNGTKVSEAVLRDGDEIRAGRTVVSVHAVGAESSQATHAPAGPAVATVVVMAARDAPPTPDALSPHAAAALSHLRAMPGPLYAVLDAGGEPTVPARLLGSGLEYESLYEDGRGDELAAFGPWVVRLTLDAEFLGELTRDGWGAGWSIFLTSDAAPAEIYAHLRKHLISKLADGRQVYFRFYDPRILRTYLPTCTAAEVAAFVGPVRRYACESVDGADLLEFAASYRDWGKFPLGEPG